MCVCARVVGCVFSLLEKVQIKEMGV
jgi:hypothetical protein